MCDKRLRSLTIVAFALAVLVAGTEADGQYFGQNKVRFDALSFHILKTTHFDIHFYDDEQRVINEAAYLAGRYGTDAVGELFLLAIRLGDPISAIEQFAGTPIAEISRAWHQAIASTYALDRRAAPRGRPLISLGRRAAALASGFFAGQITESIGGALDLDIFEFDAGANANGLAPALTLGEQFGQRLYLRVRQGVGNLGSTQVALEYEITDWLRLQSRVSDERPEAQSLFRRSERSALRGIVGFSY